MRFTDKYGLTGILLYNHYIEEECWKMMEKPRMKVIVKDIINQLIIEDVGTQRLREAKAVYELLNEVA